jgi:DNA-binding transcriptional regulator YiaG
MSDRQIAKIIKGKKKNVAAWSRDHGLPPNKSNSALSVVEAKLLNINENETVQPNSESSTYDPGTIENFVGKEIKKNTIVFTFTMEKTNNDILKQLFTKGFSDAEIAKYFDVSERTISNRCRNLGLYRQKPRQIRRKNIDIEEFKTYI